jgi:tRNA (guanosine-2'-O-)-methyltransferase
VPTRNKTTKRQYAQNESPERIREQLTDSRLQRLEEIARNRQRGLTLLLDDVYKPNNLAAIARTADAMGIPQIHYTSKFEFDPNDTYWVAAKHANKWIEFTRHKTTLEAIQFLQRAGWTVFASTVHESSQSIYALDWLAFDKIALLVGNERDGVQPEVLAAVNQRVHIPMRGMVESLNVSVAAAMTVGEVLRQREASGTSFSLAPVEHERHLNALMRRALF